MTRALPGRLARLPVQVAPRLGEETDSFIRRLARANHLKPSYLHGYLCGPPFWFGKPLLDRLADAAGRSPQVLERALADTSSPRRRVKPNPRYPGKNLLPGRGELSYLISDDARDGTMTIRALAERYEVPQRAVRLVLNTARPADRDVKFRKTRSWPPSSAWSTTCSPEEFAAEPSGRSSWTNTTAPCPTRPSSTTPTAADT